VIQQQTVICEYTDTLNTLLLSYYSTMPKIPEAGESWQHSHKGLDFDTDNGFLDVGEYAIVGDLIYANTLLDGFWAYKIGEIDLTGLIEVNVRGDGFWNVWTKVELVFYDKTDENEYEEIKNNGDEPPKPDPKGDGGEKREDQPKLKR